MRHAIEKSKELHEIRLKIPVYTVVAAAAALGGRSGNRFVPKQIRTVGYLFVPEVRDVDLSPSDHSRPTSDQHADSSVRF